MTNVLVLACNTCPMSLVRTVMRSSRALLMAGIFVLFSYIHQRAGVSDDLVGFGMAQAAAIVLHNNLAPGNFEMNNLIFKIFAAAFGFQNSLQQFCAGRRIGVKITDLFDHWFVEWQVEQATSVGVAEDKMPFRSDGINADRQI
jgi:hypothetical protein